MGLPYNGWSDLVRHGRDRAYYQAQRKGGILPPATACLCCKAPFCSDSIPYHAEEYGPTLEDYWVTCLPLCHRCHAMVHARFATPNRWKRFLTQASTGSIDESEFPNTRSTSPSALEMKFKARADIAEVPMPAGAPDELKALPIKEYRGPWKVAKLRVKDRSGNDIDVADWMIYGPDLSGLKAERPDVEIQQLLTELMQVDGYPDYYLPRYLPNARKIWYRRTLKQSTQT